MADYWTIPKVNWIVNDGIGFSDLNRIEANISANRDANIRKLQGFGFAVNNFIGGQDGVVTVLRGNGYSLNGFPIRMDTSHVKNLTTWAPGNGPTIGGMAAAVTVAAHTWYYIFLIMDPSDGSTEIMFDDNIAGTNVSSGIYTEKRFIHSFKTDAAGGDGSFDLVGMFAIGDNVFINPDSMYPATRGVNYTPTTNVYNLITLTEGSRGLALPARDVKAVLNVVAEEGVDSVGLISAFGSHFSVPTNFINSGIKTGEFVFQSTIPTGGSTGGVSCDCDIMVPLNNKVNAALLYSSGTGDAIIAVRGFHDERLL